MSPTPSPSPSSPRLNIYFQKKRLHNSLIRQREEETTIITNLDELPFTYKEHLLAAEDEEQITKILKKQIIFQDISQEILSVLECEMLRMVLPEGKIIYDLNDDGHFFYIIAKGKVVINIQNNLNNALTQWHTFGEISLFNEKKRDEVIITKEETEVENPAFDIVESDLITGIITEEGIKKAL